MPRIAAFRGVRYDVGHVGSLEGVVCPKADLIDAPFQKELYERHPANAIRLIKNRDELGDEPGDTNARVTRFFRNWQREGVLQREPDPALYVYHQVSDHGDGNGEQTRRGFFCLMHIDAEEPLHREQVSEAEVADRLELLRSVQANLSTVVGIYSTLQNETQELLEPSIINVAPIEMKDATNIVHRIWPITQIERINEATTAAAEMQVAITSGLADYLATKQWIAEGDSPAESERRASLMVCLMESDAFDPLDSDTLQDVTLPDVLSGMVFHSHNTK